MLGRKYIGIDISKDAIEISKKRLAEPFKTDSQLLKLGRDSYKTKTENELAILHQFDCEIVQRNKGIDAFLKKYYSGRPVAIRIQKNEESFSEVLSLLKNAVEKKKCSYGILISCERNYSETNNIPSNIVVLNRYDIQIDKELKARSLW